MRSPLQGCPAPNPASNNVAGTSITLSRWRRQISSGNPLADDHRSNGTHRLRASLALTLWGSIHRDPSFAEFFMRPSIDGRPTTGKPICRHPFHT
jgi:hypothetical protein